MTELGTITAQGTTRTLRFERTLAFPVDAVWAALTFTLPEQLGEWLAAAEVEPGPRARSHSISEKAASRSAGSRCGTHPGPWRTSGASSASRRLTSDGSSRSLRAGAQRASRSSTRCSTQASPTTHAHLDRLEGYLRGDTGPWQEPFDAVLATYREAAATVA
jgi:hypothetical protein